MRDLEFGTSKEILYSADFQAIPVTLDAENVDVVDGKKVLKAGTLLTGAEGSLFDDRTDKAVETSGATGDIDGVLLYDVDLTYGDRAASLVYVGSVWANKVQANVTNNVKNKLNQIKFISE